MNVTQASRQYFILSILVTDRPGIVGEVSKYLFDRSCSIEDSRMAVLGGEFAMALLAFGKPADAEQVRLDLPLLQQSCGLSALYKPTRSPAERKSDNVLPYRIKVTALDHPGIVFHISRILHEKGINIQRAETETFNAPFGGSPLFHLDMLVEVPAKVPLSQLRATLNQLADQENMDLEIQAATTLM